MIADLDPVVKIDLGLATEMEKCVRHFVRPMGPGHPSLDPPLVGMNMCHYQCFIQRVGCPGISHPKAQVSPLKICSHCYTLYYNTQ